jgi:hypothetical protein
MAKVNLVEKRVQMGHRDIIKYQIITFCFINDIKLSGSEVDCLTLLGLYNKKGLSDFCKIAVDGKIFKTTQTVRNFLNKAFKKKLIIKTDGAKKDVSLNNDLKIQTSGNIVLDYKMVYVTQK